MANRQEVVQGVLDGIEGGQGQYEKMTGGEWVWQGSEYWLTVHVALGLWDLVGDGQVTVEGNANETMEAAGRSRGRRRLILHGNRRFDIVLWYKNGAVRAPIEIKSQQSDINLLAKDGERVKAALTGSGMKFGIAGYYYSSTRTKRDTAKKNVESYVKKVIRKVSRM